MKNAGDFDEEEFKDTLDDDDLLYEYACGFDEERFLISTEIRHGEKETLTMK